MNYEQKIVLINQIEILKRDIREREDALEKGITYNENIKKVITEMKIRLNQLQENI